MSNLLNKILALLFITCSVIGFAQGEECEDMELICTDVGLTYYAVSGTSAEEGNDYGCLLTQPDPSWFYLQISASGNIEMALEAASDIDFIMWGPFANVDEAKSNCGSLGDPIVSPIVDCSYSGAAYETPEIPSGNVGEVYVLLVTNYAAVDQEISLSKIAGTGETTCGDPPILCVSEIGTFYGEQYGELINIEEEIILFEGNSFIIRSNEDYILPNDTIEAPFGDGFYTAQIMWLVYDAYPLSWYPESESYTGIIIPMKNLYDVNNADSPIIQELGYGTYYFVPITADDGIGGNENIADGVTDNGELNWDLNSNGCWDKGEPVQVTYFDIVGTEKNQNWNDISIFPNPFDDYTTLNFEEDFNSSRTVVIYNVLGEEVYCNENLQGSALKIKKEQLGVGVYFLTLYNPNLEQVYNSKLIVE